MYGTTNIIYADNGSSLTSALFGKPLQATQDYIHNTVQNYTQALGGMANTVAREVQQRFNEIRSSTAVQVIENVRNRLNSLWKTDSVRPLQDIESIQTAPPTMQRWVMAYPPVRALYNQKNISAYDDKYVDLHPGGVAETHYDYRRVMDGVFVLKDGIATSTNYRENIIEETDTLSLIEKMSVLLTWDTLSKNIASGSNVDPTSVWNGTL